MLGHIEKARSVVRYAALLADEDPEKLRDAASIAKVCANQAYVFCSQQAIQLHGGIGFTWEQDLHLYFQASQGVRGDLGRYRVPLGSHRRLDRSGVARPF